MKQEKDVKEDGNDEKNEGKSPDDESKGHARQDGSLTVVFLGEDLDLVEEAEKSTIDRLGIGGELGFVDGLERKGIDDLARTRTDENANPSYDLLVGEQWMKEERLAFKTEVGKESNVLGTLFTLCQSGKH